MYKIFIRKQKITLFCVREIRVALLFSSFIVNVPFLYKNCTLSTVLLFTLI